MRIIAWPTMRMIYGTVACIQLLGHEGNNRHHQWQAWLKREQTQPNYPYTKPKAAINVRTLWEDGPRDSGSLSQEGLGSGGKPGVVVQQAAVPGKV